jgi:hypothetical protein
MELQHSLFDESDYIANKKNEGNLRIDIGTISEIDFMSKASQMGFIVFLPIGHDTKADVIIWKKPKKPITIQVKKALLTKYGTWTIKTCTGNGHKTKKRISNRYIKGDFDILAAHITEKNCWAFWRLEDICGKTSMPWYGSPINNFELLDCFE